jgi:hypothetical protein
MSSNPFRERVVRNLRVEHQLERRVLSLVTPGRVRMELDSSLMLKEIVILARILKVL